MRLLNVPSIMTGVLLGLWFASGHVTATALDRRLATLKCRGLDTAEHLRIVASCPSFLIANKAMDAVGIKNVWDCRRRSLVGPEEPSEEV